MKTTNNIEKLLGKQFCINYHVDTKKIYEIEYVDAKDLIVSRKIDLIAKIKYVEAYISGYKGDFFNQLYIQHIWSFSNGTFVESNQRDFKNSQEAYIEIFNKLIDDIRETGFDSNISIIPVGKNNTLLDGAHRVAIAAHFNLKVPVVYFNDIDVCDDAVFFENRMLPKNMLDYLIYEYCNIKNNIYAACLWPISNRSSNVHIKTEELLSQYSNIVYKRKISIDINMLRNFMIQVYSGFDWLGAIDSHFIGASNYAEEVNDDSGYLTLYILESDSLDKIKIVKNKIRDLYKIGNCSIHISDTHDEAMSILQMLLNDNSLHCLKYSIPDKYKKFNIKIDEVKKELKKKCIDIENLALDSGSVLALYGLRDTTDIDYISTVDFVNVETMDKHCGNEYLYSLNECDILNNPLNHFYYYGLKFISIPLLIDMKKRRYERNKDSKDKDDIYLLNSINGVNNLKNKINKISIVFKRKIRNLKFRIIDLLIHSVFYKPLRYVYYKVLKRQ